MKNNTVHTKSLELLDQFIAETSSEELIGLISKYEKLDIQGPTFDEYLNSLQNELELSNLFEYAEQGTIINATEIGVYKLEDEECYYIPPPEIDDNNVTKKDSVNSTESFFLLYLHHDRS